MIVSLKIHPFSLWLEGTWCIKNLSLVWRLRRKWSLKSFSGVTALCHHQPNSPMGTFTHEYAHMLEHTFVHPHTTRTSHTNAVQQTTHHAQAQNMCRGTHTCAQHTHHSDTTPHTAHTLLSVTYIHTLHKHSTHMHAHHTVHIHKRELPFIVYVSFSQL